MSTVCNRVRRLVCELCALLATTLVTLVNIVIRQMLLPCKKVDLYATLRYTTLTVKCGSSVYVCSQNEIEVGRDHGSTNRKDLHVPSVRR